MIRDELWALNDAPSVRECSPDHGDEVLKGDAQSFVGSPVFCAT